MLFIENQLKQILPRYIIKYILKFCLSTFQNFVLSRLPEKLQNDNGKISIALCPLIEVQQDPGKKISGTLRTCETLKVSHENLS